VWVCQLKGGPLPKPGRNNSDLLLQPKNGQCWIASIQRCRYGTPSTLRNRLIMTDSTHPTVAVIGLGYVGLPLAVEFGKRYPTLGLDMAAEKVSAYQRHVDPTGEVSSDELRTARHLICGTDPSALARADFIVVAVPTPVDDAHRPDFSPLVRSSESIGKYIKRGATVVYESTVYPGNRRSLHSNHRASFRP